MDNVVQGAALYVENITETVTPFLNEAGLAAINSNKVYELGPQSYDTSPGEAKFVCDAAPVRFLGTTQSPQKLGELINEYAEAFKVVGILSPPMSLPLNDGRTVYLCYLAFTPAAARIIDKLIKFEKNSGFAVEGEIPNG